MSQTSVKAFLLPPSRDIVFCGADGFSFATIVFLCALLLFAGYTNNSLVELILSCLNFILVKMY